MARKLIVEIIGDTSSLEKSFRKTEAASKKLDKEVGQTARGAIVGTGAFRSLGRSVGFASASFLGGAGLVAVLKSSVGAASNLAEQTSKSKVVFGQSASAVKAWSNTTVDSLGLASDQALETASSFGALLRPIGLTGQAASQQARDLTKLGADLASFYNTSVQDALDAIRSGLVGEAEPLRRYGVLLSETRVQQEALRQTGKKHAAQLTAQEKVLARIALVYRDTAAAQGDFQRTSGGFANQTRILEANVRQLEIALGKNLLPALTKIVGVINDLVSANSKAADKTKHHGAAFTILQKGIHLFGIEVKAETQRLNLYVKAIEGVANAVKNKIFLPGPGGFGGADRQPGLSPHGPGTFPVGGAAAAGGAAGGGAGPLGFNVRFARLALALAKAELTQSQKDDRAILVQQAALVKQRIGRVKKLKDRTALYQQLGQIESQITSIDDAQNQKEADARQKRVDAQAKFAAKVKAENDKLQAHFRSQEAAFKERQAKLRAALTSAVNDVRGLLGGIFSGPVFNAPAGVLGVSNARAVGGTVGAGGFVSNVRQQTAQLVAFNNDLARLARRGAPGGLISQLRQGGLEQGPLIHQLATAGRPTLRSLFRAFAQQEKVVQQIAHADVQAKTVTIVAGSLTSRGTTPSSQRRGRQAGVPSSIGSFIGG